ncbi:MAG: nuclear transport factor 2 family protein [Pseudomonadales bacterium]
MNESALTVAGRLFACIEAGNPAGVDALYATDVEVWHNFSNSVQSKSENLRTLEGLISSVAAIEYEVKERVALDDNRILQRHDLHCTTAGGERHTIPACIFITVKNGRIVRIDEYLDSVQANVLRAATGREKISDS